MRIGKMEIQKFREMIFEHKLSVVRETANSMMLWWVSSVGFCASLIGAVLKNQDMILNLSPPWLYHVVFTSISAFFISIIYFGLRTANSIKKIENDLIHYYDEMYTEASLQLYEFDAIVTGIKIGSSNFIFTCAVFWII